MKLSTKGRYGLRALVDLAANEAGEAVSLAQTAKRQMLSLNYLEQVFGMLRRAGIVRRFENRDLDACLEEIEDYIRSSERV